MTFTLLRRPWAVLLKPGIIGLFAAMSVGGGMILSMRRLQSTGLLMLTWQECAITGALVVAGLVLHETAHAVVAQATGRMVERLEFGFAGGAATSGDTTPWRRAIAIAAGPLSDIAFGSVLWAAGGSNWDTPLGAGGLLVLINGVGNILPLHKSLDGYRLIRFLRLALRGNEALACITGPCPACNAATAEPVRPKEEPVLLPA